MTMLNQQPDIEPLSQLAWKRIENGVFAQLDHLRAAPQPASRPWIRKFGWWSVAAGAAAAAAIAVLLLSTDDDKHERLLEPSRIVTADAATELIVGRATINVAPESAVWLQTDSHHSVHMILEQGTVTCAVAPSANRPPVIVQAGDVRVEVVGTRFTVARDGSSARISVQKGTVAVYHRGDHTDVSAGQSWPSAPVLVNPTSRDALTIPKAHKTQGTAVKKPSASTAAPILDGPSPASLQAKRVPSNKADAKTRYERAARLEARDAGAAMRIYKKLANGNSPWAANALFAHARLSMDRGDTRAAKKLLETYLRRFPNGANALDARDLSQALLSAHP